MRRYLALALLPLIAACAPRPDSIAPVGMGNAFASYDCTAAAADLRAERQNLETMSQAQRNAATGDAIGVFLIGVPPSSLTGGNKAGDIGASEGKIIALEARVASCG
ncbi:hypothetical protein [Paracoccus sp. 228]|uniref:hypothetical protein n=1 Tax=Paracoccus sp. 228 TaxID=1192054 RepID=UPI0005E7FA57|nr:hypothetical protein [Paracoccus sp. 228]KIX19166.1 hypothetical protein SY26_03445 [Paracoccus sp. 228]